MSLNRLNSIARLSLVGAGSSLAGYAYWNRDGGAERPVVLFNADTVTPSRQTHFTNLADGTKEYPYDILIIGGGATGTGCALDAATRGLRTALLEKGDFGGQTSSKSTKLVHGGVRYLEKAVFNLDYGQLKLVFEALHERKHLIQNAPHLASALPIMTPLYKWWEIPYYWSGLKAYDAVAGTQGLTMSRFTSAAESRRQFPTLAKYGPSNNKLLGTIVYYDGQFDDARLNVTLAISAAQAGATVLNYTTVTSLIKDEAGNVVGAEAKDLVGNKKYAVYAKQVMNCTGPFVDSIRKLSDANAETMTLPSAGVHITLPDYYSPQNLGMIVPKTKDGRVVFLLPWKEATIAGTTDRETTVSEEPQAHEDEVQFILDAIKEYLTVDVRRSDVLSTWAGIRPLALDPNAKNSESASRDHIITRDQDGLLTVTGGKWTTYRRMAEDAIDEVVSSGAVQVKRKCCTTSLPLVGAHGFSPALFTEVAQNYVVPHRPGAIDTNVAKHLAESYGDRAHIVTQIAEESKLGRRLVRGHPMIEAEVVYAARHEYCERAEDFIARRTRLAFLDVDATKQALPRIVELLGQEKGWWRWHMKTEMKHAKEFLKKFQPEPPQEQEIDIARTGSSV